MSEPTEETMDPSRHPQDQSILTYVKSPESDEYRDLRLHIAGCSYCRRRAELTALLRQQGHWLESEAAAVEARMHDLFAGRLEHEQAHAYRQELKQDPARLRAALHYASHARAMREIGAAAPSRASLWNSLLSRLQQGLNFQTPVWQTIPAAAVLLVLGVMFFGQITPTGTTGTEVIAFEDDLVVQFVAQEPQPGIGFFAQPGVNAIPFAGMNIELVGNNRLRLSWPQIETAQDYQLKLQVFRNGETQVLARRTLDGTSVELEIGEPLTQHRYEWVLSGDTSDNRSFYTSGGFVISQQRVTTK